MQILHIGTEKTGTTHLQNFLANNAEVFMQKYGIHVRAPKGLGGSSSDLVNLVADKPFPDLPKPDLDGIEYSLKCDNQIISSEHFSSRLTDEKELLRFRERINTDNREGRILLYLKPQCELLVGMFAEAIKAGQKVENLPSVEKIFARKRYGDLYFDYLKLIDLWRRVFSDYKFDIIAYERDYFPGGDICKSFLECSLGIHDFKNFEFSLSAKNKTLSPEILLSLDRFQSKCPEIGRHTLVRKLELYDPFPKGTFIKENVFQALRDKVAATNLKMHDVFGINIDNDIYKNYRYIEDDYFLPDNKFDEILLKIKN